MAVPKDAFPFAPLAERDMRLITAAFGIRSPDDMPLMDGFRHFLGINRRLALPEVWYRHYLTVMSARCLGALGMMDAQDTMASSRGALLYAGAVREAGGLSPLPRDSGVLSEKKEVSTLDLALAAYQVVDDIPSFSALLEQARPLLGADPAYDGLKAARVGSGLLHIITAESVEAAERDGTSLSVPGVTRTAIDGVRMDDGLRELIDIFKEADWPKTEE